MHPRLQSLVLRNSAERCDYCLNCYPVCFLCAVLLIVLAWRAFFQRGRGINSIYQKVKSNFQRPWQRGFARSLSIWHALRKQGHEAAATTQEDGAGWSCSGDTSAVAAATPVPRANPKMRMDFGRVGGGGSSYERISAGAKTWVGDTCRRLPSHCLAKFAAPSIPPIGQVEGSDRGFQLADGGSRRVAAEGAAKRGIGFDVRSVQIVVDGSWRG